MDALLSPEIQAWLGSGAVTASTVIAAMAIIKRWVEIPKGWRVWAAIAAGAALQIVGAYLTKAEGVELEYVALALQGAVAGATSAAIYKGAKDSLTEIAAAKKKK